MRTSRVFHVYTDSFYSLAKFSHHMCVPSTFVSLLHNLYCLMNRLTLFICRKFLDMRKWTFMLMVQPKTRKQCLHQIIVVCSFCIHQKFFHNSYKCSPCIFFFTLVIQHETFYFFDSLTFWFMSHRKHQLLFCYSIGQEMFYIWTENSHFPH